MGLLREGPERLIRVIPKNIGSGRPPIAISNSRHPERAKLVHSVEILGPSRLVHKDFACRLKTNSALIYEETLPEVSEVI